MKKILIFGGTGDTGQYFMQYCLEQNNSDYELVIIGTRKSMDNKAQGVKYIQLDITVKEDFKKLPHDIYAVVHLAGFMPARMEGYNPEKYININSIGTLNILEFCRINKVNRILYAQSFGDIKKHLDHTYILTPEMERNFSFKGDHAIYVMSKSLAVDLIKNYHEEYGIRAFIFRLPTIYLYSPIDTYYVDGLERKIAYRELIDRAINGDSIEIWGDPKRKKDIVYVKDFAQMLYKALGVNREYGIYNVGTGIGTSLEDQIKGIVKVFSNPEKESKILYKPEKNNAPEYVMDITSARNELGYEPLYNYEEYLKDFKYEMERKKGVE